jgi:hypothetical protein
MASSAGAVIVAATLGDTRGTSNGALRCAPRWIGFATGSRRFSKAS